MTNCSSVAPLGASTLIAKPARLSAASINAMAALMCCSLMFMGFSFGWMMKREFRFYPKGEARPVNEAA
jgi:hypothetical protein